MDANKNFQKAVSGECDCCGGTEEENDLYRTVTTEEQIEKGTIICVSCWEWGCFPSEDGCRAQDDIEGGEP